MYPQDRTGKRYGRLVVLRRLHENNSRSLWVCQCDCGNTVTVRLSELALGNVKSCGCSPKGRAPLNHGMSKTRIYRIWKMMHQRCNNPKSQGYENYGGRGIRVCPEWDMFEQFYADMGLPPSKDHTLDRCDNNKDYSKGNCKWATWAEQHRNRRDNRLITAFGETKCMTEWAEEYGLPVSTLKNRLFRAKMPPEDALTSKPFAKQRGII